MNVFESLPGLFKATFVYEGLTQGEAKESIKKKLDKKTSEANKFQESIMYKF